MKGFVTGASLTDTTFTLTGLESIARPYLSSTVTVTISWPLKS